MSVICIKEAMCNIHEKKFCFVITNGYLMVVKISIFRIAPGCLLINGYLYKLFRPTSEVYCGNNFHQDCLFPHI